MNDALSPPSPAALVDSHIGKRLRQARKSGNFSVKDIAAYVGVSDKQYYKFEMGQVRISARHLFKLAEFFTLSPSYFFDGLTPASTSLEPPPSGPMTESELEYLIRHVFKIDDPERAKLLKDLVQTLMPQRGK